MDASQYNAQRVPIYAPDGFPEGVSLNVDEADTGAFVEVVKQVQRQLGTTVDGFCGPSTIDAIAEREMARQTNDEEGRVCRDLNVIIIGPKLYEVDFPVITYLEQFELGETGSRTRKENLRQAVVHYDVTFNSMMTHDALERQGYSVHFMFDGDEEGTIYQTHNPTTEVAYHARSPNRYSVGLELNNPASKDYWEEDKERRGRDRGCEEVTIHGVDYERLGYFPEQLASFKQVTDILCDVCGIKKQYPVNEDSRDPIFGKLRKPSRYDGVLGHYHWSKQKTDPAPLKWTEVFSDYEGCAVEPVD